VLHDNVYLLAVLEGTCVRCCVRDPAKEPGCRRAGERCLLTAAGRAQVQEPTSCALSNHQLLLELSCSTYGWMHVCVQAQCA
jgi:hypothetical protein